MLKLPEFIDSASCLAERHWERLRELHGSIPPTTCERRNKCCALLPQMTMIEALFLIRSMRMRDEDAQRRFTVNIVRYFFLNAAQIMGCPFLEDGGCAVYEARPFGCRAYGLWSWGVYKNQLEGAIQAKKHVRKAWADMGIELPRSVTNYKPPYCRAVKTIESVSINDEALNKINKGVHDLDRTLGDHSRLFLRKYYNDLSFLAVDGMFGYRESLKLKVDVVKEFLSKGCSSILDDLIAAL